MKWLFCLFLVWHVDYFIYNDPEQHEVSTGCYHYTKPAETVEECAIRFLNKHHRIVSAQFITNDHSLDVIWSNDETGTSSDNKNADGSWYPEGN